VTINKCFKKLEKKTEELIPDVILKKYGIVPLTTVETEIKPNIIVKVV
jgi:hypothetical protein